MVRLYFAISERSLEIMRLLRDKKLFLEYRDFEHDSYTDYVQTMFKNGHAIRLTEKQFLDRNPVPQIELEELRRYQLIDDGDGMAWHPTFYLSELGKELLENYEKETGTTQ